MICNVCNHEVEYIFDANILGKYLVKYFYCQNCGLLKTEKPFWLNEAYSESINKSDTGYVKRNLAFAKKTLILYWYLFGKKYIYLDYAGGYGLFTRIMRDYGLDFYWNDIYTKNLFVKGFEYKKQNITALTCFECFEHFDNIGEEFEKILKISPNIFFSTTLWFGLIPPQPNDWWYYGLDHGQHLSFYSRSTLEFIAKKYNLNFYTNNVDLHFFTKKKLNNKLFRILTNIDKLGFSNILKFFLESKTIKDYEILTNNNLK